MRIVLFTYFLMMLLHSMVLTQTDLKDIVYLNNGNIIKGIVLEQMPGEELKIKTQD